MRKGNSIPSGKTFLNTNKGDSTTISVRMEDFEESKTDNKKKI